MFTKTQGTHTITMVAVEMSEHTHQYDTQNTRRMTPFLLQTEQILPAVSFFFVGVTGYNNV